jgi:hypothetical protein
MTESLACEMSGVISRWLPEVFVSSASVDDVMK